MRALVALATFGFVCVSACSSSSSSGGADAGASGADSGGTTADGGGGTDSGSPSDASGGDSANAGCTMAISGAATGGGPCIITLAYASSKGVLGFGVILTAQQTDSFGTELGTSMTLTPGTFSDSTVTQYAGTVLNGTKTWRANSASGGNAATGSFTLTITDAGAPVTSGSDTVYPNAHGTLSVTFAAVTQTGAVGVALMDVTF